MTKRMLIDATHAEETRVVVLDGNRLEDFDVETSTKRQLKGNIYLAKVVRVEPSLQAAFVEYGGNRHGFLAFSEIHPDYYQIPVADRQRLIEMQAEEARREEEEADLEMALGQGVDAPDPVSPAESVPTTDETDPSGLAEETEPWARASMPLLIASEAITAAEPSPDMEPATQTKPDARAGDWARPDHPPLLSAGSTDADAAAESVAAAAEEQGDDDPEAYDPSDEPADDLPPPETLGGDQDNGDDQRERRLTSRFMRNYKIQEVIRRRQILLVQVVKEERGTKGAALTTYLSLAGRFGVLMPNSPRGGGISRKITSPADRRRLKEVMAELDIPRGMGIIVRTAGANRPKPEIKRDCEYLLRLWDDIREHTMKSVAPALIYEEASLIKRAIRDVYSRDIDEILVDGEEGWRAAHDFMRMLMPSHAKKVQLWRDGGQPLFARNQVEAQLDSMLSPTVQLRSGGYLVINQAEALVAIDVNSGRSTRERNVEETALRTNLEAADEAARQLRLRDLAGLIVIDFIDMESKRHNAMVERRIKEALKNDRARIQVGHISHFGLLEMSRQRLRPSLAETSFMPCPHCGGTGHVRSTENAAIHVLRGIEDEASKRRAAEIVVYVATPIAMFLLNHKRERLREIEQRYAMKVIIAADDSQVSPQFRIDRTRIRSADDFPLPVIPDRQLAAPPEPDNEPEEEEEDVVIVEDEDDDSEEESAEQRAADPNAVPGETSEEAERRRRKRRRRRRGGRRDEAAAPAESDAVAADGADEVPDTVVPDQIEIVATDDVTADAPVSDPTAVGDDDPRQRRRGRRGGRRRRRDDGEISPFAVPGAEQPDLLPVYAGPTPADPFGGRAFDIFDVMDQVERQAEATPVVRGAALSEIVNVAGPEPDVEAASEVLQGEAAAAPAEAAAVAEPTAPDEVAAHEAAPEPAAPVDIINASAPEPAPEPTADHLSVAADQGVLAAAENVVPEQPPPAPVVVPILVGAGGEPPAEKKRGWWRR